MASRHKVLWNDGWIGELRALKRDPSKTSFWLALYWKRGSRKGLHAGYFEIHKVPTNLLQERIVEFAEECGENLTSRTEHYRAHLEQALDYLFAELGRRAGRKVIS